MRNESVHVTHEALARMLPDHLGIKQVKTVENNVDRGTITVVFDGEHEGIDAEGACGYMHPLISTVDLRQTTAKAPQVDRSVYEWTSPSSTARIMAEFRSTVGSSEVWVITIDVRRLRSNDWIRLRRLTLAQQNRTQMVDACHDLQSELRSSGGTLANGLRLTERLERKIKALEEDQLEDDDEDDDA